MAPRTRSNRAAKLEKEKILASGGSLNTGGLLSLPPEIHLEIVSHFPIMPVPTNDLELKEEDVDGLNARHSTVFALSQTCRALRQTFLRQLWRRIEVFDGMQTPKGHLPQTNVRLRLGESSIRLKAYAEELIRQLEIVTIREPRLAQYVQVVNVIITFYCIEAVVEEVAKAFNCFPNLHTVQLNVPIGPFELFSGAFGDSQYPQIQTLSLSDYALPFADICPGARLIFPYPSRCFKDFPRHSPSLEVLGTTLLLLHNSNVSHLENLQDISVVTGLWANAVQFEPLRSLPRLKVIRLRIDKEETRREYFYYAVPSRMFVQQSEISKRIEFARSILRGTEGKQSSKKIVVTYDDGRVETLRV